MTTPLLTLDTVACTRGGVVLLENVSLNLLPGEARIVQGPNGSGKTTLLRTIAGLQPPSAGKLQAEDGAIAYAAHADGLKGTLTVAENLAFWASLFGTEDIETAMSAYSLLDLRNRHAGALSAGQKRRVGLARLLVTACPVWVLDEPTVSLDAASVELFADAIRQHLGRGGAALIATHIDLGLKAQVLDVAAFRPAHRSDGAFDEAFL